MKKVLTVFSIAAALFATMSCQQEEGTETSVNHDLSLTAQASGKELPVVNTYDLKGGQQRTFDILTTLKEQGNFDIKVTYGVDESLVAAFNTTNSTSYTVLPSTAYSFEPAQVQFEKYNKYAPFSVLTITAPEIEVATSYLLPVVIANVETADKYTVDPNAAAVYFVINVEATDPNGAGTLERPYKLRTSADLIAIEDKLVEGTEIFFAMENDIDMAGVETWNPINLDGVYQFNFDGKGHKISNFKCEGKANPAFFGVVNGTVQNVVFDGAYVSPTGKGSAIVAAYCGKASCTGTIKNVTVKNSTNDSKQQMSAIIAGLGNGALIENVYVENCNIKSEAGKPRFAAFILAIDDKATSPSVVKNCYVKGGEVDGNQQVAAIVGRSINGVTVENCGASAKVIGNDACVAGILGQASSSVLDKVVNCVVWCSEIKATSTAQSGKYASGIVVGSANVSGPKTFKNCLYSTTVDFADGRYPDNVAKDMNDVEENAFTGAVGAFWHGKAAAAGTTASQAAKALGWDETIWDLSGDEPKLK